MEKKKLSISQTKTKKLSLKNLSKDEAATASPSTQKTITKRRKTLKKSADIRFYQTDCFGWLYKEEQRSCQRCPHKSLCIRFNGLIKERLLKEPNHEIIEQCLLRTPYKKVLPLYSIPIANIDGGSCKLIIMTSINFISEGQRIKKELGIKGCNYLANAITTLRCNYGVCTISKHAPLPTVDDGEIFVIKIFDEGFFI